MRVPESWFSDLGRKGKSLKWSPTLRYPLGQTSDSIFVDDENLQSLQSAWAFGQRLDLVARDVQAF